MNSDGAIIFRYDNAKHHPEIETFPHHKHLPDKVKISKEVNLSDIQTEVEEIILRNSSG